MNDKPLPVFTCSICQKPYEGFGHNAEPINSGRCCDDCNSFVIFERIRQMKSSDSQ